jgi:putative colanic acid biosynthesis acetyltransferase WcaF
MFEFRSWFLRLFGAQIGKNVHIYSSAIIYMPGNLVVGDWSAIGEWTLIYNLDEIVIGNKTTVSQRAHLCAGTHDFEQPDLPLIRKRIVVGDQAWVCADTFIGPGVNIGDGAVVGARAVVVKNVEPWAVVAGNPARKLRQRILKN